MTLDDDQNVHTNKKIILQKENIPLLFLCQFITGTNSIVQGAF